MFLPLLLFLASLQIPAAVSLNCEIKHIDFPDSDIFQNVVGLGVGCGKGPGWAAIKPENKFKRHNFGPDTDTYELNWVSLVRWPECVTQLQVGVNNYWQDVETQVPTVYEVVMPNCKRFDRFKLELRIFFPGLLPNNPEKCFVVSLGRISHTMPGISDFLYSRYITPETELSGVNLNIYWRRNKVKSSKCLDRVEATSNKNPLVKMTIKPNEGNPRFTFPRMCEGQVATVTYFFKAKLFPENVRTINIPPLNSLCNNQNIIDTTQDPVTAKGPVSSETNTNRDQIQTKTTDGTSKTSTTLTTALVIGLGAGMTISLCILVICVKRCRKRPQEETGDTFTH